MSNYCFGIDVGGTTIKCGLFQTDGTVLDKWEIVTRTEDNGKNILPDIAAAVLGKIAEKGISKDDVAGVGVGIPGPVNNGKVPVAVNLHWGETDIEGTLSGLTGLPSRAGNDANVAALGEMWKGGAEGYQDVIVVTLGTGVGGGIILGGKMVEGSHGCGGEIGHATVDPSLELTCNCGNHGCLEQFASATGIARLAREAFAVKPADVATILEEEGVTAKSVFDAYKEGDVFAAGIVDRFANYLGTALAGFASVVDPQVIVIGGGVSKAGQPLIDVVEKYYKERAFSSCKNTPIVLAKLGNDAGIFGSAKLVLG